MAKLVATEYVSLDNVMDDPGKWARPFFNDEASKFKYDELFASEAMLLGRITYEGFAAAWPTMEGTGDFGERMNGMPKYVVTSTLGTLEWTNSHQIKGDIIAEISALKGQLSQDLLLAGSGQLLEALIKHDLVDEYRLMVHPIVLGSGKRLFNEGIDSKTLKLTEVKPFSAGIVVLTYTPAPKEEKN